MSNDREWSRGMAMLLSLLVPGLGQVYRGRTLSGIVWFVATAFGYVLIIPGIAMHLFCVIMAGSGGARA